MRLSKQQNTDVPSRCGYWINRPAGRLYVVDIVWLG